MRRRDRQVTDPEQIEAILQSADCCRLGFADDGLAYIVPMNFGVAKEGGKLCLYFHSASKGKKIELIEKYGKASFEAEAGGELKPGKQACDYSYRYQSVMGHGTISVLRDEESKLRALRCIMEHYTGKADWEILAKMLPVVVGIRLEIEAITAKANKPLKV
ncbi:MAG: pyridoxamine 5'-phosphate oxidase family protein, partial [Bacillota bacterium]